MRQCGTNGVYHVLDAVWGAKNPFPQPRISLLAWNVDCTRYFCSGFWKAHIKKKKNPTWSVDHQLCVENKVDLKVMTHHHYLAGSFGAAATYIPLKTSNIETLKLIFYIHHKQRLLKSFFKYGTISVLYTFSIPFKNCPIAFSKLHQHQLWLTHGP